MFWFGSWRRNLDLYIFKFILQTPSRPRQNTLTEFKMASSVDAKLLKSTKFPPEFSQKVDMQKVNLEVMKKFVRIPLDSHHFTDN